ncbi:hypothetical protein BKA70DRAFT_604849 [Coprinopsis sp. MPI-PUGE-AT-0042]|nr:hypothetical protein BKA70DRAFT_604849 [Coprinopsis sp. MPI-PUGE-AT-0042]
MHRCLKINEILHLVFLRVYLQERASPPEPHTSPTLARLARTCQTFREPALGILWHEMCRAIHLFNLLPASKLKYEAIPHIHGWRAYLMKLVEPPTREEWQLLREYSARVKHLYLDLTRFRVPGVGALALVDVDLGAISAMTNVAAIFPGLRALKVVWRGRGLPLYHRFLSKRVREVMLELDVDGYDPFLDGFLKDVGTHSPDLLSFTLENRNRLAPTLTIEDAIGNRSTLTKLSAQHIDLSCRLFDPSSEWFSNLQILEIGHENAKIDDWIPSSTIKLPKLSNLLLLSPNGPNLNKVETLFSKLRCRFLQSLEVRIHGSTPPEQSFRSFFNCVAKTCKGTHLETLRFRRSQAFKQPDVQTLQRGDMILRIQTLEPLLCLPGLKDIDMDVPSYFSLDDTDYFKIASTWTGLTALSLGAPFPPSIMSDRTATISCLYHFAELCPDLHVLDIPFAAVFSDSVLWDKMPKVAENLQFLCVRQTKVSQEWQNKVAAYLSGLFPRLPGVKYSIRAGDSDLHFSWIRVNLSLAIFATVRQQEQFLASDRRIKGGCQGRSKSDPASSAKDTKRNCSDGRGWKVVQMNVEKSNET